MNRELSSDDAPRYLMCETARVYRLMMIAAGMMGTYTLVLRGGVFCNAQTANFALMAVALGSGDWNGAIYYLIPITAYLMGAVLSELLPKKVRSWGLFRWDTYLVGFEVITLFVVGFIPLTVTDRLVQIIINFICSMQYNTFRQAEQVPMATTFCTNHLRQTEIHLVKYLKTGDEAMRRRIQSHLTMIACFVAGGVVEVVLCGYTAERAIWLAMVPLLVAFSILARADVGIEHDFLGRIPAGH